MSKTAYHLHLKGYVGGTDFDRNAVDNVLAQNPDNQVNVLIDSTGGSLATGLSISSAFRNHGNVTVHFVGLNASAATIASLGAKHISIDAGAMYLVHQCSAAFFEWGSLNSDQFASLIADCEKIKADLDKFDLNCARQYAARCKRKTEDLLDLMKAGAWLSAEEALEWGFVDEITDIPEEESPKLTDALASAMATAGMPIPNIPLLEEEKDSAFSRFLAALTSFFKPAITVKNTIPIAMKKTYKFVCAVLALADLTLTDNKASLTDEQLQNIENHIADLNKTMAEKDKTISAKDAEIADLKAKLEKKPAEDSKQVVEDHKSSAQEAGNEVEAFVNSYNSAKKLFDEI